MRSSNQVTKGGYIMRYKALVVAGNMKGAAGFGIGKAHTVQAAVQAALLTARRSMTFVDLYENRTIFHDVEGRRGSSKVIIRAGMWLFALAQPRH
jgi:small subunit ribosomal protein S5